MALYRGTLYISRKYTDEVLCKKLFSKLRLLRHLRKAGCEVLIGFASKSDFACNMTHSSSQIILRSCLCFTKPQLAATRLCFEEVSPGSGRIQPGVVVKLWNSIISWKFLSKTLISGWSQLVWPWFGESWGVSHSCHHKVWIVPHSSKAREDLPKASPSAFGSSVNFNGNGGPILDASWVFGALGIFGSIQCAKCEAFERIWQGCAHPGNIYLYVDFDLKCFSGVHIHTARGGTDT